MLIVLTDFFLVDADLERGKYFEISVLTRY